MRTRHPAFPFPAGMTAARLPDRTEIRARARAARAAYVQALGSADRAAQEDALARVVLPHLGPPGILGAHAAVGAEIGLGPLIDAARRDGWSVAWPRVRGNGPLGFHLATAPELAPGHRGIPEPSQTAPLVRPDVLLVPLVAADRSGNRLGQGGGHYDRTLAEARSHGPVLAIGVGWDMQIVPALAAAAWDQPLDAIATPTGFHPVSRRDREG